MFGTRGLCPSVKLFWRDVAHKIATTDSYRPIFRKRLDVEYKKNEKRRINTNDINSGPGCNSGKLDLNTLKLRARATTLSIFMHDLLAAIKDDF